MDVFMKQQAECPHWKPPRVHPMVTLVAEEYKRSDLQNCDMDLARISTARSKEICQERRIANPLLSHSLTHMSLWQLLKSQGEEFWWMPGIQDENDMDEDEDEEGEFPFCIAIRLLTSYAALEMRSNPEPHGGEDEYGEDERDDDEHPGAGDRPFEGDPTGVEPSGDEPTGVDPVREDPTGVDTFGEEPTGVAHSGEEPADDDPGVTPMDEDETDVRTPRISRTQKRAIIISPSEKDKHPAKYAKYADRRVCIHFYSQINSDNAV